MEERPNVDPEQAWFWTPEWQRGEQQASADIAAGRTTTLGSADEFLSWLHEQRADVDGAPS